MKEFHAIDRARRPEFPTFVCSAIDAGCGHLCGLEASGQAPWSSDGLYIRTYCQAHAPAHATRIPGEAKFMVTRVEVRVAVPHLPGDPFDAADQAVRRVTGALEGAGALVVGFHVVGEKAAAAAPEGPPLRLELAGRPEPALRGDRPFWGFLSSRRRQRQDQRRKTG